MRLRQGDSTEKAHSKCLKLKQNGGDIDIDGGPRLPPPQLCQASSPVQLKDKKRKR